MREAELIAELLTKPAPSAETVAAGRLRLRRESPRRRPSRGLLFGGGFTALVAGGVAAAVVVSGFGGPVPAEPPTDAATILLAAAERAETTPTETGKYWHVRAFSFLGQDYNKPDPHSTGERESWTTTDGLAWMKSAKEPLRKFRTGGKFTLCHKEITYRQLAELPTDPDALYARLHRLATHNGIGPILPQDRKLFTATCMLSLLADQPAPPRVRAAAFRSLAGLPEAESLGTQRDPAGREGTVLRITYGGTWEKLIIDPETGIVLAMERVETREGQTLVQKTVFYEVGWTDTPPA
ncbi:CU044_5270 family protein [Actinocorallia populi]|uniref:CU044_5270 family protein n=1 Tax=Actinocorallia populi TaxID=2079200 RepID=UPI000D096BC7|nr:CU044_5270 family protein [Actinocorallia populi]